MKTWPALRTDHVKSTHLGPYRHLLSQLAKAREAAGCTQTELGLRLEKPQSYVSKVEAGERRLDLVEFIYWTQALELDAAEFVLTLSKLLSKPTRLRRTRKATSQ